MSKNLINAQVAKSAPQSVMTKTNANMVQNYDGAYVFKIDDWKRLERFLIMGSNKSYYKSESELSSEAVDLLKRLVAEDGERLVSVVQRISTTGAAPKADPAIFTLAYALSFGSPETKKAVENVFLSVVRTGTHFLTFVNVMKNIGTRCAVSRRVMASWYLSKDANTLAYQMLKYADRQGWSHRDVLRFLHVKPNDDDKQYLFNYAVRKDADGDKAFVHVEGKCKLLDGVLKVKSQDLSATQVVDLITSYKLPHEVIPTQYKNDLLVQEALLKDMPMTATIRNLGSYSKSGLLAGNPSDATIALWNKLKPARKLSDVQDSARTLVRNRLENAEQVVKSKVHPFSVLLGLKTYASGHGHRGSSSWDVNTAIVSSLEKAFYASFNSVEKTDKKILVAVDVSPSMTSTIQDSNISSMEACAATLMVLARQCSNIEVVKFAGNLKKFDRNLHGTIEEACRGLQDGAWGGTNIGSVVEYALQEFKKTGRVYDAIVIMTDNDVNSGRHVHQLLENLRKTTKHPTRQVVLAFTMSEFSVSDPTDALSLDIAGLDPSNINVAQRFINGEF